ncbi:MAG: 50S ribosomal protein L9 [Dehalococcoidia bacterium]|nr:50S ribosomal protein L9 [Dehalococcoidia bacterium]
MKVVFFEDVEGTAQVGDVKDVRNGFARNFLLPRNIAGAATRENIQRATSLAEKEARRQEKLDAEARTKVERLENYTVTIEARVGETGRLFGSVTNRDIMDKINDATQLDIESHMVLLPEPIRELGSREVTIKFTRNVSIPVTVDVVPDEASKAIVERLEAEAAAEREAEEKAAAAAAYQQGQREAAAAAAAEAEAAAESADDAETEA